MTKSKKTNWNLILGIPGALAALASVFTFVISKDARCSIAQIIGIKSDQCPDTAIPPNINLLISTETGEPIEKAEIDFIGNDVPESRYTDKDGFVQARIKNEGSVIARIRAKGYPIEDTTINASTQQVTTREIRLSKTGTPTVTDLNPKTTQPTLTQTPTQTPTTTPTLTTTSSSTNPPDAALPVTTILGSITFQLNSCTRKQNNVVSCYFTLTSTEDASFSLSTSNYTALFDGSNNYYFVNKASIGKVGVGYNNNLGVGMVKDAHSNLIIDFIGVPTSVSQAFLISLSTNIGGVVNNPVKFRNIPIK